MKSTVEDDCKAFCQDLEDGGMYAAARFVRSLERIRVAADALHFKSDINGTPVLIGMLDLTLLLAAHRKEFGE